MIECQKTKEETWVDKHRRTQMLHLVQQGVPTGDSIGSRFRLDYSMVPCLAWHCIIFFFYNIVYIKVVVF